MQMLNNTENIHPSVYELRNKRTYTCRQLHLTLQTYIHHTSVNQILEAHMSIYSGANLVCISTYICQPNLSRCTSLRRRPNKHNVCRIKACFFTCAVWPVVESVNTGRIHTVHVHHTWFGHCPFILECQVLLS